MNANVAVFTKPDRVDVARILRDLSTLNDDLRLAIGQARDIQDIHHLWLELKAHEAEFARLTDLAAAKLEKYLEAM